MLLVVCLAFALFVATCCCAAGGTPVCFGAGYDNTGGMIAVSRDFGKTWQQSFATNNGTHPTNAYPYWGALNDISCPTSSFCLVVVAYPSLPYNLLRTIDGGQTWQPDVILAGASIESVSCPSPSFCIVAGFNDSGGVIGTSVDGGRTWSSDVVDAGQRCSQLRFQAAACSSPSACIVGGQVGCLVGKTSTGPGMEGFSLMFTVTDGMVDQVEGQTSSGAADPMDYGIEQVSCMQSTCMAISGVDAALFLSTDSGATINQVADAPPNCQHECSYFNVECATPTKCIALSAGIYSEYGSSSVANVTVVTVVNNTSVQFESTLNLDESVYWTGITCASPELCIASHVPTNNTMLYRSTDGGMSWKQLPFVQNYVFTSMSCVLPEHS